MVRFTSIISCFRRPRRHLPPFLRRVLPAACMCTAAALLPAGCATVAEVTNLTEAPCKASFEDAMASILTGQGEGKEMADSLAFRAYLMLTAPGQGPRSFTLSSPKGTDYSFFFQKKPDKCLVHLYGRQKGLLVFINNFTYISTRELPGCACRE